MDIILSRHPETATLEISDQGDRSTEALQRQVHELTEANARLSEAVAARDSFLAVAAHELRNPMTPIIGRVQILKRLVERGDLAPEKLTSALDQIEWLMGLYVKRANTLLDVSRITTGNLRVVLEPVDACEIAAQVASTFGPLASHSRSSIKTNFPPGGLTVFADRLALEQVLDNLVSNAIKYGAGAPIVLRATSDGIKARIDVIDSGPGMSEADQARIFGRFERAVRPGERSAGFGVGLWIVHQLCQAMEGTVSVRSRPGNGSIFTVTLAQMATGN